MLNMNLRIENKFSKKTIEKIQVRVDDLKEERDKLKQQIIESKDLNTDLSVRIAQYYNLI